MRDTEKTPHYWVRMTKEEVELMQSLLHSFIMDKEMRSERIELTPPDNFLYQLEEKFMNVKPKL
jgi:hypothetical protein